MANRDLYLAAYGTLLASHQSSDLNSLASGSYAFGSGAAAVIDNGTNLYKFMDVLLILGSFTPGSNPYVTLFLLTSMDNGSTYEDPQTAVAPPADLPSYTRQITTTASAKKAVFRGLLLPPGKSKLLAFNGAGASFASSGNSITYWPTTSNVG